MDDKIISIPVINIKPYENNPRKIDEKAVNVLCDSIKNYGFQVPIIIDKDNIIVTGHTRYRAAVMLGLTEVPCLYAKKDGGWLTSEQCKAYRIMDNKSSEISQWDDKLLSFELREIKYENPDIDLSLITGFNEMNNAISFNPNVTPDSGRNEVNQEEYKKQEGEIMTRYEDSGKQEKTPVICPKCYEEFFI